MPYVYQYQGRIQNFKLRGVGGHLKKLRRAMILRGRRDRDRMVVGFTTTYAISAYYITNVVSSNPVPEGAMYSIQHYVIQFVSHLWQVGGFLRVSSTQKTDRHDVTEILLKVALYTITLTLNIS